MTTPYDAGEARCPDCEGDGWASTVDAAGIRRVSRCACWRARIGHERLAAAGILTQYKHCTLDNFNAYLPQLERAREKARAFAEAFPGPASGAKRGLFFQGLPGTGKTHLAVAVLKTAIAQSSARGVFYDTRNLLRVIRDSYNPTIQTTEMEILRPVLRAELLVLDDLGAERTTDWVDETINFIVNTRYSECRPTVFTTNYQDGPDETDPNTLLLRIGHRMRSRVAEMCEFIDLDGADYRTVPPNFTNRDLIASAKERPRTLKDLRGRAAKAQLRVPDKDGKGDLKWPGGRGGTQ